MLPMADAQVVVVHFTSSEEAMRAMSTIRELDAGGFLTLGEAALITRDADGTMHATPVDGATRHGAVLGGFVGLIVGGLLGLPIVGLLAGAGGGVLRKNDSDFLDRLISDVATKMAGGGSALAIVVEAIADPQTVLDRFDKHRSALTFSDIPADLLAVLDQART
jgi:uncharacterized membrane protein